MPKSKSDGELLAVLYASLDEDALDDEVSDADLDRMLTSRGGDPAKIAARGEAHAKQRLEARRLSWQQRAAAKRDRAGIVLAKMRQLVDLSRTELLRLFGTASSDPTLGRAVSAVFHKRKPEDVSDDELRHLLAEVEALRELAEIEREDDDE